MKRNLSKNQFGTPDDTYWIEDDLIDWLESLSKLENPVKLEMVFGIDGMRWIACDERSELCIL